MLIDLTRPTVFLAVDECVNSLVVRTLNTSKVPIMHYKMLRDHDLDPTVALLPPGVGYPINDKILLETRLPIEACLPHGYHKRTYSLERFEFPTLHRVGTSSYQTWRPRIEVRFKKDKWQISIQGEQGTELVGMSSKTLQPGINDRFPIDRLSEATGFPGLDPENETIWDRLCQNNG